VSVRGTLATLAWLGLAGCGAMVDATDGSAADGSAEGASDGTARPPTTTDAEAEGDDTRGTRTSTTDDDDGGGYEEDDGSNGCTFTCPNPPAPTPPPGGGGGGGASFECDLVVQDCPLGEKCMPWANDGGTTWNATRCAPIAADPGQAGDPCLVVGSGQSGIDDCALGLVCWQVDPETNLGVCHPLCEAAPPWCEAPLVCGVIDGIAPLCTQPCDPLDPTSCPEGSACAFFMGTALLCQPVPRGAAAVGMPCDAATVCEAGTLCSYAAALDCGNGVGQGCCAEPCHVGAPGACPGPEVCAPWFPEPAPAGLAHLGVCV
jgi:hypothetical protein